jgi:uncharacterized RDD family membrane protein YckC
MLSVKLDTGFNIEVDFPISPFYKRILAFIVDLFTIWLYFYLFTKLELLLPARLLSENKWIGEAIGVPVIFYFPLMEIFTNGQTVGKTVMGIRVITWEGGRATISQYLIRWIFLLVDFPVWIFPMIYMSALPWYSSVLVFTGIASVVISSKSQRVGDILAGTIIIFMRSKTSLKDTVFIEVEAGYIPRYPKVMQMSDKDLNSLKMIIENVKKNNNHELAFRIAERIKSKLNMQGDQDAQDFLETLLKDYNYYSEH